VVISDIICACQYQYRNISIYICTVYKLDRIRRDEIGLGGISCSFKRVSTELRECTRMGVGRLLEFEVFGAAECLSIHNRLITTMNSAMSNLSASPKFSSSCIWNTSIDCSLQQRTGLNTADLTNTFHTVHYTSHRNFSSMRTHSLFTHFAEPPYANIIYFLLPHSIKLQNIRWRNDKIGPG
jgi:hypothetical protein